MKTTIEVIEVIESIQRIAERLNEYKSKQRLPLLLEKMLLPLAPVIERLEAALDVIDAASEGLEKIREFATQTTLADLFANKFKK
jgi:hypothetical protein